ncbi:hypothetical protein M433DRAFT_10471 [Acidomyces richmondensis BFW]|nr:hypothetical protein M433DRAFT_10471 [Acidomyces richmondensis BFW]
MSGRLRFARDTVTLSLVDTCCVVYLDDILIYSDSHAEYELHVREVLARLRKFALYTVVESDGLSVRRPGESAPKRRGESNGNQDRDED